MTNPHTSSKSATSILKTNDKPPAETWGVDAVVASLSRVDEHVRSFLDGDISEERAFVRQAYASFTMLLGATDAMNAGQANRKVGMLAHVQRQWTEKGKPPVEDIYNRLLSVALDHEGHRWAFDVPAKVRCFGQKDFFLIEPRWRPPSIFTVASPTNEEMALYREVHHGTLHASNLLAHLRRPEGASPGPVSGREVAEANQTIGHLLRVLEQTCRPVSCDLEYRAKVHELEPMLAGAGDRLGSACLTMITAAFEFDRSAIDKRNSLAC